jgi:hypothetical protein
MVLYVRDFEVLENPYNSTVADSSILRLITEFQDGFRVGLTL